MPSPSNPLWISSRKARELTGMPKTSFHRFLKAQSEIRELADGTLYRVCPDLGGRQLPGQHWRFLAHKVRAFNKSVQGQP